MRYAITNSKKDIAIKSKKLVVLIFIILSGSAIFAQTKDTTAIVKHSPKKASLMSACLPGLGQAYNKKYWKIPIIYAGAAAITYSISFSNHYYKILKTAYRYRTDDDPLTVDDMPNYSTDALLLWKNYYRRNLELSYIIGGVIYALNIIDASVDAHLFNFDISDDISMNISPSIVPLKNQSFAGLSFSFTFGK